MSPITFHKPHLLIVEGKDDKWVCVYLLEILGIDSVQVQEIEGFDNLAGALKLYTKTPGWQSVERLAVLVDCDGDEPARTQSVQGSLKRAGLSVPDECGEFVGRDPAVGFCLIPRGGGCLEDLIRAALHDGSALPCCVDSFLACCGLQNGEPSRRAKAWVHAYIAATEPGMKIGEAAKAGVLRLDSASYEPIRSLLEALRANNEEAAV